MPQPTSSDVFVNELLTNILIAYLQDKGEYVASNTFPTVPVEKQSAIYPVYPRDAWFRDEAQERAPGAESAGGGFTTDLTNTYNCRVIAYHQDVPDQVRANQQPPINLDRDASEFVARKILLKREIDFAAKFLTTGLWTGSSTGTDIVPGTKWDNASGTPIEDVMKQKEAMRTKTGFRPNVMVVAPLVDVALKNNDDIIDRYKHTQKGIITNDLLAGAFGVDKYLVAGGIKNTAKEGATRVMADIMTTEQVLLAYAAPRPSILLPSAGYNFSWTGLLGNGSYEGVMREFRREKLRSDRFEGESAYDQKLVAADLGVYFNDTLT